MVIVTSPRAVTAAGVECSSAVAIKALQAWRKRVARASHLSDTALTSMGSGSSRCTSIAAGAGCALDDWIGRAVSNVGSKTERAVGACDSPGPAGTAVDVRTAGAMLRGSGRGSALGWAD